MYSKLQLASRIDSGKIPDENDKMDEVRNS